MKVTAINGSPHKNGNTYTMLEAMCGELAKNNIDTEIIHIGKELIRGCVACGSCAASGDRRCVFDDDPVNETADKMRQSDGFILGSPVYYGGITGTMKSFLDRTFYTSSAFFKSKVAAGVVVARRSGGTNAVHQLNNYLTLAGIITPPSRYWAAVHGRTPGEAALDLEGMQTVRDIARDMAWLLEVIKSGKDIPAPKYEDKIATNFIR